MDITILNENGAQIAEISGEKHSIRGMDDIMELLGEIAFNRRVSRILLKRELIDESFFDLKSGFAGELAQKFTNYRMKLAVVGDFNFLVSLALKAYIHESNLGNTVYFTGKRDAALDWLSKA